MPTVEKHINDLLYEHDCVIVPEFGGFVANYASARIHPVQHTFTPPSKKIVFNKNLSTNDGLLANKIVLCDNASYTDAISKIKLFVNDTNAQLQKGAKVKIDAVGTLYLDVERNIQFEPSATNYLQAAFGLASFQSPAILRGTIAKRIDKELNDRPAIPLEKKKTNYKRIAALASIVPVLFLMIWISLKTDLLKNIDYASLNPFATATVNKAENNHSFEKNKDAATVVVKKTIPSTITVETEVAPVKADSTAVAKAIVIVPENKYHLVVGCFQIETNALKFVEELRLSDLQANIIGKNNKGLFVVSCADLPNKNTAEQALQTLRKTQPAAWLYKN
jgi:hypothetical protein